MTENDKNLVHLAGQLPCEDWPVIDEYKQQSDTEEGYFALDDIQRQKYAEDELRIEDFKS